LHDQILEKVIDEWQSTSIQEAEATAPSTFSMGSSSRMPNRLFTRLAALCAVAAVLFAMMFLPFAPFVGLQQEKHTEKNAQNTDVVRIAHQELANLQGSLPQEITTITSTSVIAAPEIIYQDELNRLQNDIRTAASFLLSQTLPGEESYGKIRQPSSSM
ncbi:MAG: hypothetical protein D6820_01950, partial [Lentisphaerae bacterium]